MNTRLKVLLIVFSVLLIKLAAATPLLASEGVVELRSTTGDSHRCVVYSLLMQDRRFTLLVGCRDLLYPVDGEVFVYALWATPVDGSDPVFVGDLGLGKQQYRTNKPFVNMFVTAETAKPKKPEGRVVMRGNVESEVFLDRSTTPTPTPEGSPAEETEEEETQQLSTRERLLLGLRRAGLVALVALVALIGLIFVISRSRG